MEHTRKFFTKIIFFIDPRLSGSRKPHKSRKIHEWGKVLSKL